MRPLGLLFAVLAATSHAQPLEASDAGSPAPVSPAAAAAAKLDELWVTRHQPEALKQLGQLAEEAPKAHPNDFGVLWRAARAKYWFADGTLDKDVQRRFGKEAWALGDRAAKAKPDAPEGYYYAAIGMGNYSQAVGVLTALGEGLEGQFNDRLDRAIKMAPAMDLGGPLLVKGRYFFELPWPKRDLEKSASYLKRVAGKFPGNLRAYLFLAETELKEGDAKSAKETLNKALTGSTAYDIGEGERVRWKAERVSAQIEGELN